jgi:serine protease Do
MSEEKQIIQTIKKLLPAVVSIAIAKHLEDLEREAPHELYSLMPGHHKPKKTGGFKIPKFMVDHDGMVDVGGGSGFIVEEDGVILTNKHVISDPRARYTVILSDGTKYPATVVSRDPINDVAILKIAGTGLPTVTLCEHPALELGASVIAIGNALGLFRNTVSVGIISGLSRSVTAREEPESAPQELRGLIQTDAAINPGNSGGPLVNLAGEAIGINAAIIFGAENISFAIPIQAARRDLSDLKAYGHIKRPYLGVRYLLIDERIKDQMHLPVGYGAIVINESPHDPGISPKGPADRAGIQVGDIILEIDGAKISPEYSIQDFLDERSVNEKVAIVMMRKGKTMNVSATLGERI